MPAKNGNAQGTNQNIKTVALIVAALVVGAVTMAAIILRPGAVTVDVKSGSNSFSFKVAENRIDFNDLLDCLLSERLSEKCSALIGQTSNGGDSSRQRVVRTLLQDHGFYHIPSDSAAAALRDIKETETTQKFLQSIRQLLYDLAGPFSRPTTFMEASDDRLLGALDDLADKKPSSPLVAKLWEMSLDWKGIFHPRTVSVTINEDESLQKKVAATCAGSILLEKSAQVSNEQQDGLTSVTISKAKPCPATSTEDLLAGKPIQIWLSTADMEALQKDTSSEKPKNLKGILVPAPNIFSPRD